MDNALLKMAREALDTEVPLGAEIKLLRFFTAADCREYTRSNPDPNIGALADNIDEANVHTVGELLAREEALASAFECPRCAFENAVTEIVYSGEHIQQHYGERPEQLNAAEVQLLEKAREWLADDTITRCLETEKDQ